VPVIGPPKLAPLAAISNRSWFDCRTGKLEGALAALASKKTLYAPGSEEVNVKLAGLDESTSTGPVGAGERAAAASVEKNRNAAPLLEEKAIVSPLVTGTEGKLGTRTPLSLVRVTSVWAMVGPTLVQLLPAVYSVLRLRLVQRGLEPRVAAQRRKLRTALERGGIVALRQRLRY
jgi:hypothetical protein